MKCPNCQHLQTQYFLETVNTHGSFRLSEERFVVLSCPSCKVIFPRITPDKDFYKKYYPRNYYTSARLTHPLLQSAYQLVVKFFSKLQLGDYLNTDSALDFGCGQGEFLASLPSSTERYGIEVNSQAVKFIKKKYPGIKVFSDLKELAPKRLKFDLITLWHVLEHLEKPKEILQQLTRKLKKGGRLIIATPNTDSWGLKWSRGGWFHLDTPRHLAIFNLSGLVNLCRQVGLRPVVIKGGVVEYPLDLFWSIFNRLKTKSGFFNFFLTCLLLPVTLGFKLTYLIWPQRAEVITLIAERES